MSDRLHGSLVVYEAQTVPIAVRQGYPGDMILTIRSSLSAVVLGQCWAFVASFHASSLQSGPDLAGSSFPSSVAYDSASNTVVIAGSTFGHFFSGSDTPVEIPGSSSDCFLATVALGDKPNDPMSWKVRRILGDEGTVPESCSSMIFHERHSKLIVAGHSERNGFMDELYNDALLQQATKYGILMDIDVSSGNGNDPFHLVGGRVLQTSKINYPLAVTSKSSDSWIYVASQETDSVAKVTEGIDHVGNTFVVSAEVDPMRFLAYVGNYRMVLSRYQVQETVPTDKHLQRSLVSGWSQIYAIRDAPVHVAGIVEVGNVLVVAGTTNGTSPVFGGDDEILGAGSLDGFISKFNKDTGRPIHDDAKSSRRIQSPDTSHDWIAGICHNERDNEHMYVVGATEGEVESFVVGGKSPNGEVKSFVMKLHVETLEVVWTRQIGAHYKSNTSAKARSVSCVVDSGNLWVGGIVQDGAVLRDSGTTDSYGDDDIFVAKFQAHDGTLEFIRQIGSKEDDSLAMRGALALDKDGNCVVVGSTYGDVYRERKQEEIEDQPWISDVFVTIISATNGEIAMPIEHPEFSGSDTNKGIPAKNQPTQSSNKDHANLEVRSRALRRTELVVIVLMTGCLLGIILCGSRSKINRDVSTRRGDVIKYLHDFDVNDIDLKHSATGGWHCSYGNDLAMGINNRLPRLQRPVSYPKQSPLGDDPLLMAPLKDGLIRDSLLIDSDQSGGLSKEGVGNSFELGDADASQNQGYDGLVDAYNSSWEESRRKGARMWGKDII